MCTGIGYGGLVRRVDNPKNRYQREAVEWLDEEPPYAQLDIYEEHAKSIVSENSSPDLPFRYSLNPYRGCYHGCAYCYARPSHQYWGFGAGTDFERKIVVKVNAAQLLEERFDRHDWSGEQLIFSGNTDCYQPLEAAHRLTRACLEVCVRYRNPVGIITKGGLIRRDIDVLCALAQVTSVSVFMSIPFADDAQARLLEPGASAPTKRFEALAALSAAGIDTGIAVAPVIVGLTDRALPELLSRAQAAGAKRAFMIPLRLPGEVAAVFEARLQEAFPSMAGKVMSALSQIRSGRKNDSRFGERMRGQGPRWQVLEDLFALHCKKLGLSCEREVDLGEDAAQSTFMRPHGQLALF